MWQGARHHSPDGGGPESLQIVADVSFNVELQIRRLCKLACLLISTLKRKAGICRKLSCLS